MATTTDAKFSCAACGRQYAWKPELAGKKGKCKCGEPLNIPASLDEIGAPAPVAVAAAPAARPASRSADREPSLSDLAALSRGEVRAADAYRCPWCGSAMELKSVICTNCKMNIKTGQKHDPKKAAARATAAKNAAKLSGKGKAGGKDGQESQTKQLATLAVILVLLGVSGLRMYMKYKKTANRLQSASSAIESSSLKGQDAEALQLLADNEPIEAREFLDANKQRALGIQWTNNTSKLRVEDWYRMGAKKVWAFNAIMSRQVVLELPDEKEKRAVIIQWTNDWQGEDKKPLKDEGQKYVVLEML